MNNRLATWLDTATETELMSAGNRVYEAKHESQAQISLLTVICFTVMARRARVKGNIARALECEQRRERYLAENY